MGRDESVCGGADYDLINENISVKIGCCCVRRMSAKRKRACADNPNINRKCLLEDAEEDEQDPTDANGSQTGVPTAPLYGPEEDWEPCTVRSFYSEERDGVCILCKYTLDTQPPGRRATELIKHIDRELMTNTTVGLERRVDATYRYYNANLRKLLVSDGQPEWTRRSIEGHLKAAHGTGQLKLVRAAHEQFIGPLMDILRDNMMERSTRNPNVVRFDHRNLGMYLKMTNLLYGQMPSND